MRYKENCGGNLEEAENKAKELRNKVAHISDEEIARIIREDRDRR
jgi:hypothetical protein